MKIVFRILTVLVAIALLASCSTTRRIPEGQYLYTGLKGLDIESDSAAFPKTIKEALHNAVDVAPNKKWGILIPMAPVGLWVYNNWNVTDSSSRLKKWLYKKWVQQPVLVSDVKPELRVKMLDEILDNNGYFRGTASYEMVQPKNKKKAALLYTIDPGPAFHLDSIIMLPDTSHLVHIIDSVAQRDPYLRPGSRFSMDSLASVRTRITNVLKRRGYYYFRPDYIEYLADSLENPEHISLKLDLAKNIVPFTLQRFRTGSITVYANRHQGGGTPDTIPLKGMELIQMRPSKLRTSLIENNVTFRTGKYFSVRDVNNTQSYLSRLGIFNGITIDAVPDTTAANPTLNVNVYTTFDMPLEASFEVNATSKSNSYIGPGLMFTVTNHNIFGGGEQLSVSLFGNYEWQTGSHSRSIFNSYEFGINASLAFPRLLAPNFIRRRRHSLNWTRITLGGEVLNRPHYFKLAQFNTSFNYDWQVTRYISNTFTPLKFSYNKLMKTTSDFDSIMAANPAVAQSFMSQYIPQMMYSFTFDRQLNYSNTLNWTFTVQEAGNLFWAIYEACGKKGEKTLFGTPFSQFVKGKTQLVWGRRLGRTNQWMVSRVAVGAAHAYGNSTQVPYSEQFYCGGANSVRAFTVRSIGPGSYHQPYNKNDYFDQTGTFLFEANVEYRFPIIGDLNGALFLDSGNVWLLKNDPLRPGGKLEARKFFKELATGTGFGLRYDIGMLVLRGDLGIGIHAPYDTGKKGYYNMKSFGKSLAFHLAIGYPF
ncbi:MAG: BamA/TamA family outer membrane protein [Bacteroidales bacterium]|nr:BamA/TamA family outer membrane protein [Bacteroidales bacterium]